MKLLIISRQMVKFVSFKEYKWNWSLFGWLDHGCETSLNTALSDALLFLSSDYEVGYLFIFFLLESNTRYFSFICSPYTFVNVINRIK